MVWVFFILFSNTIFPEYRVFELEIRDTKTEQSRKVQSTLDHLQYATYYPLKRDEQIRLLDYWMCWRRREPLTPLCQRPGGSDELKSESLSQSP